MTFSVIPTGEKHVVHIKVTTSFSFYATTLRISAYLVCEASKRKYFAALNILLRRSLVLKTLAGMQWASTNLPDTYYYSSGDDDIYVKIDKLIETIEEARKKQADLKWNTFPIICMHNSPMVNTPYRSKTGRFKQWYVSDKQYKWPFYPRSCRGGLYTTTVDVIKQLFNISKSVPSLPVDDVWVTGILRKLLGLPDGMLFLPKQEVVLHGLGKKPRDIAK